MTKDQIDLWQWMVGGKVLSKETRQEMAEGGQEFQEIVWVLGGRSGKSTLASAVAAYETCCTDWSPYVQKGELAWFFIVATREQQAIDIGRNMIFASIKRSKLLSGLIVEDTKFAKKHALFAHSKTGVLVLSTGVAITAIPCSSRVGRGYPICGCIMDEVAWFAREAKNETTDRGVYDAILPRMIQFRGMAKMVMISTPADKSGLLYERWKNKQDADKSYFIVRLPTWKVRTDFEKSFFEHHKKMSPAGFAREFGAEFSDTTSPLLKVLEIEACMREDNDQIPPDKKHIYAMAIDAAFGDKDRFGIAVAHVEKKFDDDPDFRVVFDYVGKVDEVFGEDIVDTAADQIEQLYKAYDILDVLSDDHQSDSFGKILDQRGVTLKPEPWTAKKHRSRYGRLRSLIKQGRVSFPNNDDLLEELAGLQIKYLSNSGQYTIGHKKAGHDDMSDAVADVIYALTEDEVMSDAGMIMI